MAAVNVRIDDALKSQADEVLETLNVSATEAITRLYRYVVDNKSLPFDNPMAVLRQLKEAVNEAADVALALKNRHHRENHLTLEYRDASLSIFNDVLRRIEENIGTLRIASGGTLSPGWHNASNALKGICWMITLCTNEVPGGVFVFGGIDKPVNDLCDSYVSISTELEHHYRIIDKN